MKSISEFGLRFILFLFLACLISSCEKLSNLTENKITTVNTKYYEMDFILEASTGLKLQIFTEEAISNDIEEVLTMAGLSKEKLSSIVINEAQVSILEAKDISDLDFLRFIELTIYTDSLGEEKIAWSDPVPAGQSSVNLELAGLNLLPYFSTEEFILTSQGYLLERIYEDLKLHAKLKFQVKGEL